MRLLEDNYLGGSGSRGAGKVKFSEINIYIREKEYYMGEGSQKELKNLNLEEIVERFHEIIS